MLRKLARVRLARPDALRAVRSSDTFSGLIRRWRAAASIALCKRNFEVYRACLALPCAAAGPDVSSGVAPDLLSDLLA